jgi:hypothetical protein
MWLGRQDTAAPHRDGRRCCEGRHVVDRALDRLEGRTVTELPQAKTEQKF